MPVLVILGERDLLPPESARELAVHVPKASLVELPGSGHLPFREAPERFFAVVGSFLSEPSSDWVTP